jgi:serine protein kinase
VLKVTGEDFQEIIQKSRNVGKEAPWEGTCIDYMLLVKERPAIAQMAPARIYQMIMDRGTEPIEAHIKLPDYEDMVRYRFFTDELFGLEESVHDIMNFFKAGARRTETGKRILILVGPVSSGKSTIATLLKRGLEEDDMPMYAIRGCPMQKNRCTWYPGTRGPNGRSYWV